MNRPPIVAIVLWAVLHASGFIPDVESFLGDVTGQKDFHFQGWAVFRSFAILLCGFVVAATALTVAAASFFNLISQLTGGIDLDLKEMRDR